MGVTDEEKEALTQNLSEQYAKNIIGIEEYEHILEYINKIETKKELAVIKKIIDENSAENEEKNEIVIPHTDEKHVSVFSWRTSNVKPINGNGGEYVSIFGANQVIVDNLPKGKTIINVKSIFGLIEIIVPTKVKIINRIAPIFSGIFAPNEINSESEDLPELYIIGKAVFGNITIKTAEKAAEEAREYNELNEKIKEKIYKKIIDKM